MRTHISMMGFRNGAFFSIPSILARDCTNAMGIMKKKVRKKNATPIISLRTVSETYGIAKFCQYTSRGSVDVLLSQTDSRWILREP